MRVCRAAVGNSRRDCRDKAEVARCWASWGGEKLRDEVEWRGGEKKKCLAPHEVRVAYI